MAQRKGNGLDGVGVETIFVVKDRVMTRATRSKNSGMALKDKIKVGRVGNSSVDDRSRRSVSTLVCNIGRREHLIVVPFSDNDQGDLGPDLQFLASLSDQRKF